MGLWFNRFSSTDYERILVPWASQYNLTNAVSLCVWVNINVLPVSGFATYITLNDYYTLQYSVSGVSTEFSFRYASSSWRSIVNNITPTTNVWFHVVGTYNSAGGSNNMKIYTNGILSNQATYTDTIYSPSGDLSIGSLNNSRYLQGVLADCRIYNRALTEAEVLTIYSSKGHDNICQGLIGRWLLNECGYLLKGNVPSTGVIKDLSNYKNNGNILND